MSLGSVLTPNNALVRDARMKRFDRRPASAEPLANAAPPQPPAQVDSIALFKMGFAPDAVGQALVSTRGDAGSALTLLEKEKRQAKAPTQVDSEPPTEAKADAHATPCAEHAEQDEARELQLALHMSLQPDTAGASTSSSFRSAGSSSNPLWEPPRYLPAGSIEAGPRTLGLLEHIQVRDGGYAWQGGTAFLDTGNQALTLIDPRFAEWHGVYRRGSGLGTSAFGQAERWTTIRGVVPGAETRAPVVTVLLKLRDQEMLVQAAVSPCTGHDLLLGADVIRRLFEAGFRLGAGSM
ncbi:hypothetical protein EMIHUDRAFT_447005 [Emiliania huxleyi CCMP1516]|uniref:UBA domain-containing protein n=2 Tax=Emiliania huxleyi TaxID=2903 RepID=A0A0D3KLE5_EMIH1|nr:hypothetical protein EMIHUDRAFT_447005 [Emiliania huxleyi CCMP1516]EOD36580.1 hypothetical protein EMIHUDRAFT_447005 [Emiliania huxleyi CCMP1516]|eukprot:XP_005789009.1 hypothetical protein EMIHUDRAFT_447005 [Emiliania huxleyi CCMP1516]